MAKDVDYWVKKCKGCCTVKGSYVDPVVRGGSGIGSSLMDMLCIDFRKMDPSKNGKENVLVMMDAFSKLSSSTRSTCKNGSKGPNQQRVLNMWYSSENT